MAAVSPSSSPRLPSPPPIAEDQIWPTSPGVSQIEDQAKLLDNFDAGAGRRIRPGTKSIDMAEGPPLVELQEIDSAFQLTEHLKALHYHFTHPPGSNEIRPVDAELARKLTQTPPNTSREIWLYELGRFLIQKTNAFLVALFADSPPCNPQTCPEMRASEWQYLCAVHDPPKSCSAIDYCCHTLDWAATSLTSSKMFPSRLGLGSGGAGGASTDKFLQQQIKEITNIFRRVYRIYAHAWFQHREMFWKVEGTTGLYIFFKTVCDEYTLIQQENYTIPPEAETGRPHELSAEELERPRPTSLLLRPGEAGQEQLLDQEPAGSTVQSHGNTTKRHTRVASNITESVQVIQEEAEEEDDQGNFKSASLGRSGTVLRDSDEKPGALSGELEEESILGITRSDTLKPEKQDGEEEAGETTVISLGPEQEAGPVEPTVKVEAVEPDETPAAAADDASTSVKD